MDILNNITKISTGEDSIVQKLNLNLDQVIIDKQKIENLVDIKRKQLAKLEELLELLSRSEDILLKIKKTFKCEKCSSDLKKHNKNILEKKQIDQRAKYSVENQAKSTSRSELNTFDRLQKILNDCNKTKQENSTNKYQYSIENKGIQIYRSKPYPELEPFDFKKFKFVQIHMNEPFVGDFNSIKEWTIVKKTKKNLLLESRMAKRNNDMMNQVKKNVNSETFIKFTKRNLINDMYMLMNYDFCNNKYGHDKKKPKKSKKKIKNVIPMSDKNEDLMMELYGFETENKENETKECCDDLYDDLNDNTVADMTEFGFDKFGETTKSKKNSQIEDTKKFLSPKKQFSKLEVCKKEDAYSRRKANDKYSSRLIKRRSRSNSRSRKRSRSRSNSRSNSKRRELDTSSRDRYYKYKNDQRHRNYNK